VTTERLTKYIAMDRRHAVALGQTLPDRETGALLLADISGFTPLTEALATSLGPRQGAEELTKLLNEVYTALVARVHHFGGSIVCFIGDALVACFPNDPGDRAVACGLQMQRSMKQYQTIRLPKGGRVSLAMKAAVTAGSYRRLLVGDPDLRQIDVLAGETVERLADAEHVAEPGDVIVSPEVERKCFGTLIIREYRSSFGVVEGLTGAASPSPWPILDPEVVCKEKLRPSLLSEVYERIELGHGEFIAELRPIAAIFLRFTGIDYDQDDRARNKLDAFTRWVQSIVHRLGGHVLLLTTADKGSHLYAVFGALTAHEDDCERAVSAAMELLHAPTALDFVDGIQIGVSHGRARVGAYGGEARRTYGALGDVVNLAARLMGIAPLGEVRCSAGVADRVRESWTLEPLDPVQLKGIREPQPVFRPIERIGTNERQFTNALVGREDELDLLRSALEGSLSGHRSICLIEGEAGIGKSRLVDELLSVARSRGANCLLGFGDSIEQHAPYHAWQEILRTYFGIDPAMSQVERQHRVVEKLKTIDDEMELRAPLLNELLVLEIPESPRTQGLPPEARQESVRALVAEILSASATDQPLVILLDDVHWLDSLSWEMAIASARAFVRHPVLMLLTHRPFGSVEPPGITTLSGLAGTKRLSLGALPAEAMSQLAAEQLGVAVDQLPAVVSELVTERSEGNPFFVRELVNSLQEANQLQIEDGAVTLTGDPTDIQAGVPDTLEGLVLARLDRLPSDEQLTMKVASVIGRSFLVRTLGKVYPSSIPEDHLRQHLDDTTARRFTVVEAPDPELGYAFHHVVTQQVTYDTLLYEQRRNLHRNVAAWIEDAYSQELETRYPALVFHHNRAGQDDAESKYCQLAGAQAASQYANTEAEMYLTRVLELEDRLGSAGSPSVRFDVLQQRARVYAILGRVEDERSDLEALLALSGAYDDPAKQARVLVDWADFHNRCGQFEQALDSGRAALATFEQAEDRNGRVLALEQIGKTFEEQGEFALAREQAQAALEAFVEAGNAVGEAGCVKSLGVIHARLGELTEAMTRFENARDRYRALGDRKGEADMLGNLGALSYYLGDYEATIRFTEQAQPMFEEMGNLAGSARCLSNLGNSYSALGAFTEALACHQQSLGIYEQLEDASSCADSYSNLGNAYHALAVQGLPELYTATPHLAREIAEALRCHNEALSIRREIQAQSGEAISLFGLGSAHLTIGELDKADQLLREAMVLSEQLELIRLSMRCRCALARLELSRGRTAEAQTLSDLVMAWLGEQDIPDAEEMQFTHYLVLRADGLVDEAKSLLEMVYQTVQSRVERLDTDRFRDSMWSMYREIERVRKEDGREA